MKNIADDLVITDITELITVHNTRGKVSHIQNRRAYGLTFCTSGQIRYMQDGEEILETPTYAVILPMGKSYDLRTERSGDFPVINFLCREDPWERVTAYPIERPEALMRDYEKMQALALYGGNRMEMMSIFYSMLHRVLKGEERGILAPAVKYIEENYFDSEMTNSLLAEKCRISEVYFRKLFAEQFGVSPRQFLIEVRLNKAKQLLSGGSLKISAVSEKCGFSNPYHFCRAFKNKTGMTPTEYAGFNKIYEI